MNAWATGLAAMAFLLLLVIPIWGAIKFNPTRARGVKYAERLSDTVVEQYITYSAPTYYRTYTKTDRLDRHPYYLAPHVAAWCYAICIFDGATLTSNVQILSESTRDTMAACFLIGSSMVLIAATFGTSIGRFKIIPKVRNHLTAAVLGDDVTLPYWVSGAGVFSVSVSWAIYSITSFSSTTGSLGGWLTACLSAAAIIQLPMLYYRIRKFTREDKTLITEAVARLKGNGDAS